MTIVCATDFSSSGEAVLATGAAIVSKTNDTDVIIAHVLDSLDPRIAQLDLDQARSHAARTLEEACARFRERTGTPAQPLLLYGTASEAIAELAVLRRASLVIVSSGEHGTKSLRRLGGTSERLAQIIDVPLLVVRDATPFSQWARGERPLAMLLGVDRTTSWEAALGWVNRLREAGPCDVVVARVYYAHEEREHYGLPHAHALAEPDQDVESLLVRDMSHRISLHGDGGARFQPVLGIGRLGDHLVELAKAQGTDVIVLGTHRRRGLARYASVASVTLHYARASVLLVPPSSVVSEVRPPRRVLVATDLSPLSNKAVAHAFALIEGRPSAEITLLHVDEGTARAVERGPAEEALRLLVPSGRLAQTRVVVVRALDVAKTICTQAERAGADVVCLASHGRTGVIRSLLGSIAEQVLRESDRPVLVVRLPRPE